MNPFEQLAAACRPIIKHYHDDLEKHDKALLERNEGIPFMHWTRECGTSINFLWPHCHEAFPPKGKVIPYLFGTANRTHILYQTFGMGDYYKRHPESALLTHYFDGTKLQQVNLDEAADILRLWRNDVERGWAAEERMIYEKAEGYLTLLRRDAARIADIEDRIKRGVVVA